MTAHHGVTHLVKGSIGFLITLLFLICPYGTAGAATLLGLAWNANAEPDVAGYRIHAGTASGIYSLPTIDVGPANAYSITTLNANTTYYFVVTAYDRAGNESLPSNEIAAQPKVILSNPSLASAVESGTGTVYILQSGHQSIEVNGGNFQSGATLGLGAGIGLGATSLLDSAHLTAPVTVGATASLGPRTLSLTNPDGATASLANALTVVKTADINRDCTIDPFDLNLLARAWMTTSADGAYLPEADLDGDGYVDGTDLTILVDYLAQPLVVCP
jgi:hypothetical protein